MIKRIFDLVIAVMALAFFAPVLAVIALAICSQNDGPVIFRQKRIGRFGKLFVLYKFRTMRKAAGSVITIGADPRITPLGKFLRLSKLDELPQFFNVLRGEMSLVGPRPETPEYLHIYSNSAHQGVLSLRPGITDLASIKYRNEADILAQAVDPIRYYEDVILPDKLKIAAKYAETQSLMLDLRIIWMTIAAVVCPSANEAASAHKSKRNSR